MSIRWGKSYQRESNIFLKNTISHAPVAGKRGGDTKGEGDAPPKN